MECPTQRQKKNICFEIYAIKKGLESTWEYAWKSLAVHFDTSVVNSIILCYWLDTPERFNLNFSSRNLSIGRLIRWCCIELQKIHYTSSSRIIQLLLLFKEDCFDKTANILLVVVYVSPTLPTWNSSTLNDDHSLNMLDFHKNKVPTLQNAWVIRSIEIIEMKPRPVRRNSDERKKKMYVQTILFFFQSQ